MLAFMRPGGGPKESADGTQWLLWVFLSLPPVGHS